MKILFVNNFRGRGGGEEFLRDLLPSLAARGVKVGLVCRTRSPLASMFFGSGVTVYPVERDGAAGIRSVITVARIIREGGYEVVDIQRGHDIIMSWIAARVSRRNVRLLYTPQVPEFLQSRFLLGRMDRIVTISRYIRDKIVSFSPSLEDRIKIIHYGINMDAFVPKGCRRGYLRGRFSLPQDAVIIGMVGDLWKNQIEFLGALAELRKSVPNAYLVLVAAETAAPHVQRFKEETDRLGLSQAVFWGGRLSKTEMRSFYADIDLAVSTHRNEGFGIWILEALAMGKPVIAFNSGGIRDSLEGCPAGVLVSGGAPEMAKVISDILRDRERYERMAVEAPKWVRARFTKERMVGDYHAYFQLLAGRTRLSASREPARPLRVLLMISKNDRYGAQRIFLDQVSSLQQLGHDVVVAARGNEGFVTGSALALGVPYHGIAMKGLGDVLFICRFVKRHGIDLIHTTLDRADYFGLIVSRLTGAPMVSTMMVPRVHPALRFADRVVVLSRNQRDLLEGKGLRMAKISLIRPGIDVERFAKPNPEKRESWRRKLDADVFSIVFCHIASLIPRKAHAVSIDLIAECKRRGETPLLIIIGDPLSGEYYDSLQRKIAERDLAGNVVFTGWTSEVPEILSLSHFTVLPSENEALGVVLMEGMAAGTPVIAREGEGGAELIEEFNAGFLYRPEAGIGGLADQIIELRRDEARYRARREQCRTMAAEQFSLARSGERLVSAYHSMLKGDKAGR